LQHVEDFIADSIIGLAAPVTVADEGTNAENINEE
jgi:hypothetical protein